MSQPTNPSNPMKPEDAARIQSTQTLEGKDAAAGSFPARAQAAAAKNVNTGTVPDTFGQATNNAAGDGSSTNGTQPNAQWTAGNPCPSGQRSANTGNSGYWFQADGVVYDDMLPHPMTPQAAAHIQSEAARRGEDTSHGSFASRAMAAAAHNVAMGIVPACNPTSKPQQGNPHGPNPGPNPTQSGQNPQQADPAQSQQGQQPTQGNHPQGQGQPTIQGSSSQGGSSRRNQSGFWHQQGETVYRDMLPNPMTPHAAAIIQSESARRGEDIGHGSFAARAQEGAAHNVQMGVFTSAQSGQGTYWDVQNGIIYDDMSPNPMTPEAAAHIMSEASKRGEDTSHGSFSARAHAAAVHNVQSGLVQHRAAVNNRSAGGAWRYGATWDRDQGGTTYRDMLPNPMTPEAAAHIQSESTRRGEEIGPGSFAARAQAAAAHNVAMGIVKPMSRGTGGQQQHPQGGQGQSVGGIQRQAAGGMSSNPSSGGSQSAPAPTGQQGPTPSGAGASGDQSQDPKLGAGATVQLPGSGMEM
ncbi:uncharacterized protein LOC129602575 [Paramacrobiotus metropolitanus]|uniref:uncharacterized protein LOC129602575 n=1 Tax=Paramacrobiotus metropolitanus TaxID=2943436 RepID=UPI002445BEA3|nr:uncharacterized protein LOC129602575 [Paramacrobiotus metropolitanus]